MATVGASCVSLERRASWAGSTSTKGDAASVYWNGNIPVNIPKWPCLAAEARPRKQVFRFTHPRPNARKWEGSESCLLESCRSRPAAGGHPCSFDRRVSGHLPVASSPERPPKVSQGCRPLLDGTGPRWHNFVEGSGQEPATRLQQSCYSTAGRNPPKSYVTNVSG